MTAKIIPFTGITKLDSDPDIILESLKGKLQGFVFVGWNLEGDLVAGSTYADGGIVLWLLEKCKQRLLDATPEDI